MGYYIIVWIVAILSVNYSAALCGQYTSEETNDAKISSNHEETGKVADIMKTACIDYCMPVLENADCAVSYIANDVGNPDGPGECMYYNNNCGGGCSTDQTNPGVVIVFTCTASGCGPLTHPTNGLVDLSNGTITNSVAIYSCNLGYQLSGSLTRTCGSDGIWSSSAPVCNAVDCGDLSNPTNGLVDTSSGTLAGNQAIYSCNHGYTLSGANTNTCGTDGFWNAVEPTCDIIDCGIPDTLPTNGFIATSSGTTYLQEAVYSCNEGYIMEGANTRVCQYDGSWNGSTPLCNVIDCGPLMAPNNGSINLPYGTTFGMVAEYSCSYGYVLQGAATRTCLLSGFWTGSQPHCADIRSVQCLAAKKYPRSIKMMKTNSGDLHTFSLLMSAHVTNVVHCVRMCTTQFRETCDQSVACLFINYDFSAKMCHLYHADMNGQYVMCNATNQCFIYEYYEYFM